MLEALDKIATESETVSPVSRYELSKDLFESPKNLGASNEGDRSVNKARLHSFGKSKR